VFRAGDFLLRGHVGAGIFDGDSRRPEVRRSPQRCVVFHSIRHLEGLLTTELKQLVLSNYSIDIGNAES
jgi:hypothetical protein